MKKWLNKVVAHILIGIAAIILIVPAIIGLITGGFKAAHNITRKAIESKAGTDIDLKADRVKPD